MADLASSVIYGYLQVNDSITANNLITAPKLTLTQTTGTAPMTITSTTLVSNLNVDYLDGQHGSYYLGAGNLTGTLSADRIASNSITLAKLETIPTATILGRNTTAEGNIEELSTATVKTMLNLTGTNSGDQNLFSHIHALNSSGTDVTNSPFNVTSSAEALTLKAGTNVTLAMNTSGVVTITSAYTNTATAADGIFDGTNTGTEIKYSPYSTQQTGILSFDTSATAPTRTDRLNLNGYFYATQLYEGSTRALVRKTSDTTVTTHKFALFDTSSGDIIRSPITFNDSGTSTSELISASQVNTRIDNAVTGIAARLLPPVADLTALKAVNTTTLTDKTMINCETLGLYRLDLQSSATADDNRIIAPTTGSGRWFKMSASINDHNNLTAIQGGGTGDYQHLTTTQLGYIHASGSDNQNLFSTIAVSGQSNIVADTTSDTLTLVAGTNVTLTTNATNDSVTITSSHPDITAASSVNNSGRTYIQDITLDSDGHVTALSSATESVVDTNTTYSIKASSQTGGVGLDLDAGGSGSGTDTVIFKGGTNVTVSYTDANTITIASTDTNTDTLVTQTVTTTNSTYPILFTNTVNKTATSTDTARFGTGVKINPSTSTISATVFSGNLTGDVTGNVSGSSGSCTGNAATATKLATSRTISLTGDVTGSASFDGSDNAAITATVEDDSHNHTIANVDSLQDALDDKAPLASPALTGTPTAPTQSASDDSTKIATTAHVKSVVIPSNSLVYSGPRRIPSLTEPIGVVLVQTGGGAGVWDRVDLDGNPVACPPGYFSSRSEYSLNTSAIDNQCMVEIKKFHYANVVLSEGPYAGKRARFLNKTAFSGSQAHPAFLNSSGVGIDQFYVGAYEGYDDGGSKVGSTNNKPPLVSINFTTMLSRCAARNAGGVTGFQLIDIYQLAAIQYLALVEMGNPDAQVSLGRGNCDAPSGGSAMQTGTTTAIWRALHELWGNVWMMVQGIENRGGVLWVWNKNGTRAFVNTGFTLPSGGWVVDMSVAAGASFDLGALFIPGETAAASDSGSWSDYFWIAKDGTTKVCYHGGYWYHGPYYGLFYLILSSPATYVGPFIGGRLAKV